MVGGCEDGWEGEWVDGSMGGWVSARTGGWWMGVDGWGELLRRRWPRMARGWLAQAHQHIHAECMQRDLDFLILCCHGRVMCKCSMRKIMCAPEIGSCRVEMRNTYMICQCRFYCRTGGVLHARLFGMPGSSNVRCASLASGIHSHIIQRASSEAAQ